MTKKVNIEKIIKANPLVDRALLEKSQKLSKKIRPTGKQREYNIAPPFSRRTASS